MAGITNIKATNEWTSKASPDTTCKTRFVTPLGHWCGYVTFPITWTPDTDEAPCHGGVTWDSENADEHTRTIGFDCGHCTDKPSTDTAKVLHDAGEIDDETYEKTVQFADMFGMSDLHAWTYLEVADECERLAEWVCSHRNDEVHETPEITAEEMSDLMAWCRSIGSSHDEHDE